MQGSRFDAFTRWTAQRVTRRTAVIQTGAGVAAALGVTGLANPVVAQNATPAATPVTEASPAATVPVSLLYVQYAGLTTLVPGEGDVHILTMTGVQPQTTYFSDRPNRIAGAEPTATFIDKFAESFADSAPNASLIGHVERGGVREEAVVLTLLSATYDEAAATLTYEVTLLNAELITDVAFEQERLTVLDAPREYAEASLFIDDVVAPGPMQSSCDSNSVAWNNWSCDIWQYKNPCYTCCYKACLAEFGVEPMDATATFCEDDGVDGSYSIWDCTCGGLPPYSCT